MLLLKIHISTGLGNFSPARKLGARFNSFSMSSAVEEWPPPNQPPPLSLSPSLPLPSLQKWLHHAKSVTTIWQESMRCARVLAETQLPQMKYRSLARPLAPSPLLLLSFFLYSLHCFLNRENTLYLTRRQTPACLSTPVALARAAEGLRVLEFVFVGDLTCLPACAQGVCLCLGL